MLNIIAILTTFGLAFHAPNNDFINPIGVGQDVNKYENLINIATSLDIQEYVRLSADHITYDELRQSAIHNCRNNSNPSIEVIDTLIAVEKVFNPPNPVRGMILAAACMESGFRPNAKGDRKFSKDKKTPKAIGVLQQWSYYERAYGTDRTDPRSAGMSWMTHIVRQIPKVKKQCGFKTDRKVWVAAWVTGIRYKKKGGRCNEAPKHYRLLKKWHRDIKKDRITDAKCGKQGDCGC